MKKPITELELECERLRAERDRLFEVNGELASKWVDRNRIIEECARVALAYNGSAAETPFEAANAIAAAIMTLKDKPCVGS